MDVPYFINESAKAGAKIKTIEMHTTGEPTRIVYSGFPDLTYATSSLIKRCDLTL